MARLVRAIHTVSPVERFRKIAPIGILPGNQIQLPASGIFLDTIFPADGIRCGWKRLEVNQPFDAITLGKPLDQALAVFPNAAGEIVGHAGIERAADPTGENINIVDTLGPHHGTIMDKAVTIQARGRDRMDGPHKAGHDDRGRLPDNIQIPEEELDLIGGGFGGIRTMHRIGFDGFGEFLADGARRGIGGFLAMAFSPSSTCTTTGPLIMKVTRSLKKGRSRCTP
jgi:hypothetical protein